MTRDDRDHGDPRLAAKLAVVAAGEIARAARRSVRLRDNLAVELRKQRSIEKMPGAAGY